MTDKPKQLRGAYKPAEDLTKTRTFRLTDAHYEKFMLLGGVKWLRDKIKRAKVI